MTKYNEEYVNAIKQIIDAHKLSFALVLKNKKNRYLYDYILEATKDFDIPFNTRVYWVTHEIYEFPKCVVCGKPMPTHIPCHYINGYRSTRCSQSCAQKDPITQEKIKNTCLERYGETSANKSEIVKKKVSDTHLKFSEEKKAEIQEKRKATCLERYGVDCISKCEDIKQRIKDVWKDKSDEWLKDRFERTCKTKLERYGDPHYINIEKAGKTKKERFEANPELKKQIAQKTKETNLKKYGVALPCHQKYVVDKRREKVKRHTYNNIILKDKTITPLFTEDEYVEHYHDALKWKCNNCGQKFECIPFSRQGYVARCLKCFPLLDGKSKAEKDIAKWLKTITSVEIVEGNRQVIKPKELDIYIPSKQLAIEYDGLYWHSVELDLPKNYHLDKTNACEEKGIQLIHIFENEWLSKQDIVKSRLKNLLGIYDKTIFARKCEVKEVDSKTSKAFQDENHIQGAVNASINLGLYFDNQLISLMTFGKTRFNKNYEYELLRFCNKLGYHIPGAAGKLLKQFEKTYNPKSLVSYADRRWSTGKLYKALGFTLDHISAPNYWYWNYESFEGYLESRVKYQKHKLSSILKNYDDSLSETENMRANGYMRIYDCGNYVFTKSY